MAELVALAFSGGLDTCWCIPRLRAQGYEVATVTVDVGGLQSADVRAIAERSERLGAVRHLHLDRRQAFFDQVLRHLIAANALRGGAYPLCVGAERTLQAVEVASAAEQMGAHAVAHGCTSAGNDQIRFEVALRCYAPGLPIFAPVRDESPSRAEQLAEVAEAGVELPKNAATYSVNQGLWGATIGGAETAGTTTSIPESEWILTRGAFDRAQEPIRIRIGFESGIPIRLDGSETSAIDLIQHLNRTAGAMGIGRGIHLGETILGIKGRVAFEAPGAIVLLAAHRELEKLILTRHQSRLKDMVAAAYADWVHEGLFADPACRDAEALLTKSQERVTGEVALLLRPGSVFVEGVESPFSLHAASKSVYGEAAGEWTPADAKGFAALYGLATVLHFRAGGGQ